MDTFKVYLPSNACPDAFPNNSSTDYRTQLKNPINLEGAWKVGVASISYSPSISDEKERAQIDYRVKKKIETTVHTLYEPKFLLKDGKWLGHDGITPPIPLPNSADIDSVIQHLNNVRKLVMDSVTLKRFQNLPFLFHRDANDKVIYYGYISAFSLQLSNKLCSALGFENNTIFTGHQQMMATKKRQKVKLTADDYVVSFMDTNITKKKQRVYVKQTRERFGNVSLFVRHVQETKALTGTHLRFEFENGKLVVHNDKSDVGIVFSSHFADTFHLPHCLLGKSSCKGTQPYVYHWKQVFNHWYFDMYTSELETTIVSQMQDLTLELYPWHYKSIKQLLRAIKTKTQNILQVALKDSYNAEAHMFDLSLEESDHCSLVKGPWINCRFSKNLSTLLGVFPSDFIQNRSLVSMQEVNAIANHSRQLHLMSNVIQPTSYGQHQRQILCDFLHMSNPSVVIEKHFKPISYHTVARNIIDMIHVQLTDEDYQPISIKDATTIVTLYFSKDK